VCFDAPREFTHLGRQEKKHTQKWLLSAGRNGNVTYARHDLWTRGQSARDGMQNCNGSVPEPASESEVHCSFINQRGEIGGEEGDEVRLLQAGSTR
jgi:hypothetical protein